MRLQRSRICVNSQIICFSIPSYSNNPPFLVSWNCYYSSRIDSCTLDPVQKLFILSHLQSLDHLLYTAFGYFPFLEELLTLTKPTVRSLFTTFSRPSEHIISMPRLNLLGSYPTYSLNQLSLKTVHHHCSPKSLIDYTVWVHSRSFSDRVFINIMIQLLCVYPFGIAKSILAVFYNDMQDYQGYMQYEIQFRLCWLDPRSIRTLGKRDVFEFRKTCEKGMKKLRVQEMLANYFFFCITFILVTA